jgi:hypothetical protein
VFGARTRIALALIACCSIAVTALAQRRGGFGGFGPRFVPFSIQPNAPYDGRFTFVRVKYETAPAATGGAAFRRGRMDTPSPSGTS